MTLFKIIKSVVINTLIFVSAIVVLIKVKTFGLFKLSQYLADVAADQLNNSSSYGVYNIFHDYIHYVNFTYYTVLVLLVCSYVYKIDKLMVAYIIDLKK